MSKLHNVTVGDLEEMLATLRLQKQINSKTEIWLSSDEEGNNFSPLSTIDGQYNIGISNNKLTLYPL